MEGEHIMKFSGLFRVVGKGTEIEVYRENPGQYICSVTSTSWVPQEVFRAEVKTITPVGLDRLIVVIRKEAERERKD